MHSRESTVDVFIDFLLGKKDPDFIISRLVRFLASQKLSLGLDLKIQMDNCCECLLCITLRSQISIDFFHFFHARQGEQESIIFCFL